MGGWGEVEIDLQEKREAVMALCWEESIEMARIWRSGSLTSAIPRALERGIEHCETL